ncbi:MAG: hypothetical protein ACLSVD_06840 [Eggerthellaceae bacterium]
MPGIITSSTNSWYACSGRRCAPRSRKRFGAGIRDVDGGEPRAVQDGGHHVGQLALVVHQQDALAAQVRLHHAECAGHRRTPFSSCLPV